jgi:DNA polymerase III subunit epsilon
MSWHLARMAPFDLETTGPDPEQARIVEAYFGRVGGGRPAEDYAALLVNPGVDCPAEATKIHGYSNAHLQEHGEDAVTSIEVIACAVAAALQERIPLVGHNIGYDLTVLDRECRRYGLATPTDRAGLLVAIDTKVLSKHVDPYRRRVSKDQGAHVLKTCAQVFAAGWNEADAHGARYDALTAARIAWRMGAVATLPKEQRPKLASKASRDLFDDLAVPLSALFHAQITWAKEQAESYAQYLRKQGDAAKTSDEQNALWEQAAGVRGDWPMVPYVEHAKAGA